MLQHTSKMQKFMCPWKSHGNAGVYQTPCTCFGKYMYVMMAKHTWLELRASIKHKLVWWNNYSTSIYFHLMLLYDNLVYAYRYVECKCWNFLFLSQIPRPTGMVKSEMVMVSFCKWCNAWCGIFEQKHFSRRSLLYHATRINVFLRCIDFS